MPTIREHIKTYGGGFAQRLVALYDDPTFDNLMEAYLKADGANRRAIEQACRAIHIGEIWDEVNSCYTGEFLPFPQVHNMWLQMNHAGNLRAPLAAQFEAMERLEEEHAEPWKVPLRRGDVT